MASHLLKELEIDAQPIPLRDGREHHLYRLQTPDGERILKFPRPDALKDPFDPERSSADRLRGESLAIHLVQGVPVPRPYHFYNHTRVPCSVMGLLPGCSPEAHHERKRLDWVSLMGLSVQMGRMLAHIHHRRRPPDGAGLPDLPGSHPEGARLLHLDFHIGNVLGHPQTGWQLTGVLDWTCARWGPPEADLVELQVSVFSANPQARDAFISGYRQISGHQLDIRMVEERAAAEIQRRLVEDPPAPEMLGIWSSWLEKRKFSRSSSIGTS